jgi:hypothetical protein
MLEPRPETKIPKRSILYCSFFVCHLSVIARRTNRPTRQSTNSLATELLDCRVVVSLPQTTQGLGHAPRNDNIKQQPQSQKPLPPNPSKDFIQISGMTTALNFRVHNVLGTEILNGNIEKEGEINIQNLVKGIYVIHFENGTALKFVKN